MTVPKREDRVVHLEETFSRRIAELEAQVSRLSRQIMVESTTGDTAWWKTIVGVYKDDPEFDEAERLGREYRESLRNNEPGDLT